MIKIIILLCMLASVQAFRCINFYGLEVPQKKFVCSWVHDPGWYLDKMKELIMIDSIRLPFSQEYVTCSDMRLMDSMVAECKSRNVSIILDYHRGYSDHQGPFPVETGITKDMWIDTLLYVLDRYHKEPHVKAITLFNEIQGFDKDAAESIQRDAVDIIESIYPKRYIYMLGCPDWGKDCTDMWKSVPAENIMIEMHTYGFAKGKLPPPGYDVFVGEIGWRKNETSTFDEIRTMLRRRRIKDICLWTVGHSSDTDNLFQDDCITTNQFIVDGFNSLFANYTPTCLRGTNNSRYIRL